jgi:hypothetical protein
MSLGIKMAALAVFLFVQGLAHWRKWYYRYQRIDMLTHFLGGLALGAFLKDFEAAIALIVAWEFLEMLLVRENRKAFREKPLNKASDLFLGVLGYTFGLEFL